VTQPNPPGQSDSKPTARVRPGQLVAFVVHELELRGHAVVLKVLDDLAHLAILGPGGHVQTSVENLTPAKVDDVPNPLPAPEPDDEGTPSGS
jgi:hypothetical protein